jgi:hypothetical protein
MNAFGQFATHWLRLVAIAIALAFCAGHSGFARSQEVKVQLTGAQEIPPVETAASGIGILSVAADKSVSGSVTVSGMSVTVAHVHEAGAGTTGLIIIPLTKTSDTVWTVPAGAKLTDGQYESFKAGNLYFNVHSAAHKTGEIRGQIRP